MTNTTWKSLKTIRDWINREAYGSVSPRVVILRQFVSSIGFVAVINLILLSQETLLIEFVMGAIGLHILEIIISRIWPKPSVLADALKLALKREDSPWPVEDQRPQVFGVVATLMELSSDRGKDFPLQQNAILALSLLGLANLGQSSWKINLMLLAAFFAIKVWEESRISSAKWRSAALAMQELL